MLCRLKKMNLLEAFLFLISSIFYILYVDYYLPDELPWQAWFYHLDILQNFLVTGNCLEYFSSAFVEHGMLAYSFLFFINFKFFDLTTRFDAVIHIMMVLLFSLTILYYYCTTIKSRSITFYIGFIILLAISFNTFQISTGAMETQVHMGVFFSLLSFIFFDKVLGNRVSKKFLVCAIIMIILSINVFGTLYTFGGISGVFLICFYKIIKKTINYQHITIMLSIFFAIFFYLLFYNIMSKPTVSNALYSKVYEMISNPIVLTQSILSFTSSSTLGYAVYVDKVISKSMYIFLGLLILCIYVYSIFRYRCSKMYQLTYLPLLMFGYSYTVLILVLIGRPLSWDLALNSWYIIHTKFALLAVLWILLYDLIINRSESKHIKTMSIVSIVFIVMMFSFGEIIHYKRIPAEKNFFQSKQQYLFYDNLSMLPIDDNGNTPLVVDIEALERGVKFLKDNKLSVFSDDYFNRKYRGVKNIPTSQNSSGYYFDDHWLLGSASFRIRTSTIGKITIKGYYPAIITGNETGAIIIDGVIHKFKIMDTTFVLTYEAPKNKVVDVKINSDFLFPKNNTDERELSFILKSIIGE